MRGALKVRTLLWRSGAIAGLLGGATVALAQGGAAPAPDFAAQVQRGWADYAQHCAACHGDSLTGGQFAPALKGAGFLARWGDAPI